MRRHKTIIKNNDDKTKYVLCIPSGGFNDQLSQMELCYKYCQLFNRTLLIDTSKSNYNISFDEYFSFENSEIEIIYNSKKINDMLRSRKYSINHGNNKNNYGRSFLTFESFSGYDQDFSKEREYKEDILIHKGCGKGYPKTMINLLRFNNNLLDEFKKRFDKIKKPYLCLYIRNTDRKSDYKKLYQDNKDLINNYNDIYIATDNKDVLSYFNQKDVKFNNFTTFGNRVAPIHTDSSINKDIKIKDLICDMLIIGLSDKIITNSNGGFVRLIEYLNDNKDIINKKIL